MSVIKHTNNNEKLRKLRKLNAHFCKRLQQKYENMLRSGELDNFDDFTNDGLLFWRKKLVSYIKSGMQERKDMELEIAVIASVVFAQRMDFEERESILTW